MENNLINRQKTFGGYCAIAGAVSMVIGAVCWGASGTDLWATLGSGEIESYLGALGGVKTLLVMNTTFWILGVLLMGIGGSVMAELSVENPSMAKVSLVCLRAAVPVAIVSFVTMLSLAVQTASEKTEIAVAIAGTVGWIGVTLDDIATVLIISAAPFFISIAGHKTWAPGWLRTWGILAGLSGVLSVAGSYIKIGTIFSFFPLIPVGIGWMIAAGIVLVKGGRKQ